MEKLINQNGFKPVPVRNEQKIHLSQFRFGLWVISVCQHQICSGDISGCRAGEDVKNRQTGETRKQIMYNVKIGLSESKRKEAAHFEVDFMHVFLLSCKRC